ncbi:reverse transcriptase domain-containing protein [Sphingobacterium corticis]|uniref:Reverse transcriptase domain-containing protein n=1 Tax=Sphingobacterium corticis TaxID=1812823 RepID=A0ABW5NN99_9SPHI
MKRIANLYEQICSISNLELADHLAQKGKSKTYGVITHNKNRDMNLLQLQRMFLDKTYKTSNYQVFKVFEPKERDVYRLPYFPDRIAHHAIMNVLEPIFVKTFTSDTYSCIKGMGLHKASRNVKHALKDVDNTTCCLKIDIKKFYTSVDHDILKKLLRRKFKDQDLLWLLDEIIDSASGLPIGNYLSQYFANFYLTYFDHWIKEVMCVRYYFRYADDIVILHRDKGYLHDIRTKISAYLSENLNLEVKDNRQVFPVASRGIDFLGYVHYHTHTLLRKTIKKRFARKVAKGASKESIASYLGWLKHADCINLKKKLLPNEIILDV